MQQIHFVLPLPPLSDGSEAPPRPPDRQENLVRFQMELEFIQCLANPAYLRELFIKGFFAKKEFINYLEYLQYWREPEYIQFIIYPTCLVYLALLLQPSFRDRIADPGFISELQRVGVRHHETWRVEKPPDEIKAEP